MASGIKVGDDVKTCYQQVCMKSCKTVKFKYAIFKYSDDRKKIEIEETVDDCGDQDYDCIVSKLPPKEPRFLAYDFDHLDKEHHKTSTVIMVSWCPEGCPIRDKLIQGSTINGLKAALSASNKFIEADCLGDITRAAVNDRYKWPID